MDWLFELLKAWGPGAALMLGACAGLALWTGSKGVWVWGWTYKDKAEQADAWEASAKASTKASEDQAALLKSAVELVQEQVDRMEDRRRPTRRMP